jgi:hypothetical protein
MSKLLKDYNSFKIEVEKITQSLHADYNKKIELSRENQKEIAHYKFFNKLNEEYQLLQKKLENNSRFFIELENELNADNRLIFEEVFETKLKKLSIKNKPKLLKDLSKLYSLSKMFDYLNEKHKLNYNSNNCLTENLQIQWNGKSELEFVQLIYGLYYSNYLNNKENEVTNLVKQVAKIFNMPLGKNWESNLSDSIHNRSNGYQPKIFQNLIDSFEKHRINLITERKEKKLPQVPPK